MLRGPLNCLGTASYLRVASGPCLLGGLLLLASCSNQNPQELASPHRIMSADETDASDIFGSGVGKDCKMSLREVAVEASPHVAIDSQIEYSSNPPTSGPHYPVWAQFGAYDAEIPRGYWVHNLEHGSIVFLVGPDVDEADKALFLQTFFGVNQVDTCPLPRFVLTPDSQLTSAFAVVAWGWLLEGDCVAPTTIRDFTQAHLGNGAEGVCSNGSYVPN